MEGHALPATAPPGAPTHEVQAVAARASKPLPRHIGFIPDGNRRWAVQRGMAKQSGYAHGIGPGLALFERCRELGIEEVSVYGFTQDNTRRPSAQTERFREACVQFALEIERRGAALLVVGDERSPAFPPQLHRFRQRQGRGAMGSMQSNVNS